MSSNRYYGHLLARIRQFLVLTDMSLLHCTRSSSRNNMTLYQPPLRRAAAIRSSRRSMTSARLCSPHNLNPQYPLFGLRGRSHLQVTHQPQMARSNHTRVKNVESDSRGAAIYSGTCGYTLVSGHLYALSQVAGRSLSRYVVQTFRIVPHVDLMCLFILDSAPRWMYICVYIPGRSRTAASIQDVTRLLAIRVHLRDTEERTQGNVHISVKIPSAKRRSPGERR